MIALPCLARRLSIVAVLAIGLIYLPGCDSGDPQDPLDGPATVTGLIIDSQLGEPIENATVTLRLETPSAPERSTPTNSEGEYTFTQIATGTFTMIVRASGYLDLVIQGISITDGQNVIPPTTSTVAPPEGAYRIVLTWGQQPSDLDAHLTGPNAQGGRFHVAYFSPQPVPFADLDRDDVSSFGPETITVNPIVNGMYRYSVHNFSNQSSTGSQGIAGEITNSARARVQVYSSTGLVREYLAPPSTPGNTWRVFEMNAQGGNVTWTDINTYVTASSPSDMSTFRPVPKEGVPSLLEHQ